MFAKIASAFGLFLTVSAILGFSSGSRAQDEDGDLDALQQTQKTLTDPALRQDDLRKNPKGQQVDANVRRLGANNQNSEEIYSISADLLATLTKKAANDPVKLQQLIDDLAKHPESLENPGMLTDSQKGRIKDVSKKIGDEQAKRP